MGKKFNRLERKIEKEYEHMGRSKKDAEYIGKATAGKIFRMQLHNKIKYPHEH